uniref:Reverse transcriptase n=1 Tax=Solanum chacoense TaxID=4108 RepID=A0A8E7D9G3_SOLCH|nr:reverse transcriptase [Solanum chacoense]
MNELNCIPEVAGLSYEDLCIHPNLDLPEGFKVPKFEIFGGTGNRLAHLRAYCDQLVGVGRNEALLMRLFSRSLSGETLEWFTSHKTRQWSSWNALAKDFIERFAYNVEIVHDRYSLEKMKQKPTESYREFAYRWRKEAARVRPSMSEKEIVEVFVRVQEPEYYDRIMLLVGEKFVEIVKVVETIEDGLRTGKIARVAASPGSSGLLKKKKEDVSSISYEGKKTPRKTSSYQGRSRPSQSSYLAHYTQADYQNNHPPSYQNTPPPIYQTPPPIYQTPPHHYRNVALNCANVQTSYQTPPPTVGHDTEDCINLKHKIQDLIDQNVVSLQTVAPNVNSNPLPNHGGATINMIETDDDWCVAKTIVSIAPDELERAVASLSIRQKKEFVILTPEKAVALVPRKTLTQPKFVIETAATQGMTRSGRCYTPEELAQGGQKKDQTKRPISEAEAEEFWRKMQPKDYSIVKHLEKTPAQISVDNLAAMIHQVIRGHQISFCEEELPFEGRMHNKAMHVTIKCREKVINRVLVNDGSGLNICPLSTLKQLKFDLGKVQQNQVNVRAFDEVQRDTIGAVNLDVQMGPAEFNVEFQVLDINTSYNLLLGRPFIHMAGAVPSTLHQLMKFVWKDQELVIHGEGSHSDGYAPIVHKVSRGCDFYTVELVNATDDDLAPQPPMPVVYKMIATVMLQNGFEPGFGLGKYFQGIVEPVQIPAKGAKFGLGYIPTDDEAEMKNKNVNQALAKPIPHLYQSFPVRESISDGGLGEGIWGLFEEIDTVIEEEAGTSGIRDAEPEEQLQNWTSTPLLISRSFSNINLKPANVMSCHEPSEQNEVGDEEGEEYEEENEVPEHVAEEFRQFVNQHKPNLEETETVNLGDEECVKEVKISVHLTEAQRRDMVHLLWEYIDVFAWSYRDMPGLSTNMVSHKLPINPDFSPVKQKTWKFKPELSLKIKDEITKQIESQVVEVTQYPTWLANVVPVAKKDEKIRICVDYKDLNKASTKDNFSLPNIHILIDNCAKHEMQSFVDSYAGYHQILMDEEDAEKTAFITPWGVYHYRVMPFGLKNAGSTYMRAMTTIFHDMIHKEIEVYVDDVIIKSRKSSDHLTNLRKFFDRLRRYNLKLNPAKYVFGVPAGKLLGFIVSRRGIELDPSKIKAIQELPPPKTKKKVMSFLGRFSIHRGDGSIEVYFPESNADRKLAKWQMLLSEFDIVYVTQKAIKAQVLADHLVENPVDEEYEPLKTYFLDEEVTFVGEDISEAYPGWRVFFDGAANHQGKGIRAVLVSETGQHYPMAAKLRFECTNNVVEYEACILGLKMAIDINVHELLVIGDSDLLIHQVQGEWAVKNPKITPDLMLRAVWLMMMKSYDQLVSPFVFEDIMAYDVSSCFQRLDDE